MATICLNMIVKNESRVIERCLQSVRPIIDHWVIVDTGSTDGTQELIKNLLSDIPGTLVEEPWVNFEVNRSSAIKHAVGKADYLMVIDADMELEISSEFDKNDLTLDWYYTKDHGSITYERTLLIKEKLGWQYHGVTHEWVGAPGASTSGVAKGIVLHDHYDGGSRANKYYRDIELLSKAIEQNPNDTRSMFYLAQSYKDVGDFSNAIIWYDRRAASKGWEEEAWYSLYQLGRMKEMRGDPPDQVMFAYLLAWNYRPWRAEPLYELARYCRLRNEFNLSYLFAQASCQIDFPSQDRLFVHGDVYTFSRWDELTVSGFYVGEHKDCHAVANKLIRSTNTPKSELLRVRVNRDWHEGRLNEKHPAGNAVLYLNWRVKYPYVSNLSNYLEDKGYKVHLIVGEITGVDESHKEVVRNANCAFIWHGENGHAIQIRKWCEEFDIPAFYMEVGWFPQSEYFVIDPKGINASSSLMESDLSWVSEWHYKKLERLRQSYLKGRYYTGKNKYILVPLQIEEDANILFHSPYKTMQQFIEHVEAKFAGKTVIIKQHPRCTKQFTSLHSIIQGGDILELAQDAELVYGINSTSLLETALMKVPTIGVGRCFLNAHPDHEKMLAALVDRQIPVSATNLDYWVEPFLARVRSHDRTTAT